MIWYFQYLHSPAAVRVGRQDQAVLAYKVKVFLVELIAVPMSPSYHSRAVQPSSNRFCIYRFVVGPLVHRPAHVVVVALLWLKVHDRIFCFWVMLGRIGLA